MTREAARGRSPRPPDSRYLPAVRLVQLGGLDVRITGGTDGSGGGDGPVVVLMHGFGAPADDLIPLGDVLAAPAGTRFVFPGAPHALPGMWPGARAWWMIDLDRYARAISSGGLRELAEAVPPGMAEARAAVEAMLDALQGELQVAGSRMVLGGFSQGSMLALDLAMRSDRPLAGLVLMSSTFQCRTAWIEGMARRAGLPVFQSHGHADPILPFALAVDLRDQMRAAGLEVDWVEFPGGHEIPPPVVRGASAFLARALG